MLRNILMGVVGVMLTTSAWAQDHQGHGGNPPRTRPQPDICKVKDRPPSVHCSTGVADVIFDNKGNLWAAWAEGGQVYVAHSQDRGQNFSPATPVTTIAMPIDDNGENRPKIRIGQDGVAHVSFTIRKPTGFTGIVYYSRSEDQGLHFSPPKAISDDPDLTSQRFDILGLDKNGRVFLAWIDKRESAKVKKGSDAYRGAALYMAISEDGGKTFGANRKIQDNSCECCRLGLGFDTDGSPVLVWRNIFAPNIRDHALMKIDSPQMPGKPKRISDDNWAIDACPHHGPALSVAETGVYDVVWHTQGQARKGLFFARSLDAGQSFSAPHPIGVKDAQSAHPHIWSRGQHIAIAWKSFAGKNSEILWISSKDGGQHWSKPQIAAETADASDHPFLIDDSGSVYLSWLTAREGWRLKPLFKIAEDQRP